MRMTRALDAFNVALTSHPHPLKAVAPHHLGMPLDMFHRLELSATSINTRELGEWAARLLCLDHTRPFLL